MRRLASVALAVGLVGGLVACQPDPTGGNRPPSRSVAVLPFNGTTRPATRSDVAKSWRPGCPVSWTDLSVLVVSYWGYDGARHRGPVVVADAVAGPILKVFDSLYRQRFQIQRIHLVDDYGADDAASMRANNTSAFNCRPVAGTTRWSEHSFGKAIDINPVQNPYVVDGTYDPPAGKAWAARSQVTPGMIVAGGAVVGAFDAIGWGWGGRWTTKKDYQHFSASGR